MAIIWTIPYGGGNVNIPTPTPTSVIIPYTEAFEIIRHIYQEQGWSIDHTTTRDQRNLYLEAAVAVLYYGHPKYSPNRRDVMWCIKNTGVEFVQSDTVITRLDSREYWEIAINMGSADALWSLGYGGVLGLEHNIYVPTQHSLTRIR